MKSAELIPNRATIAARWQAPALMIGLTLFGSGLYRIVASHRPLTFEDEMARVQTLFDAGALTRLNAYLIHLLRNSDRPATERGEFHRQLARVVHAAEIETTQHKSANAATIIANLNLAIQFGIKPSVGDWMAVADAYVWSRRNSDAIDALRQALRQSPPRSDQIRRRLIELQCMAGRKITAESVADLDAIIQDEKSSPANYLWAVEKQARLLLDKGDSAAALALVEQAAGRLSGSTEIPALGFVEALCLRSAGRRDEAELKVRSLRENLDALDETWGKSGWLLGELELEDGRPQSALAFFQDVERSFSTGPLYYGCNWGIAKAMIALERPERGLEVLKELGTGLTDSPDNEFLDLNEVRTRLTTLGRSMIDSGLRELGVSYLELALSYASNADDTLRARYLAWIATGLRAAATDVLTIPETPKDVDRAKALFVRAAETELALSRLSSLEPEASADALESAAEDFDRAGQVDPMIAALRTYVERFTPEQVDTGRVRVLARLGQALQAIGEYREAAEAYEQVVTEYPRQPEALGSRVPRAECLIQLTGDDAKLGEKLLLEIVDDRGSEPLFTPGAQEYRDALMLLAEYYCRPTAPTDAGTLEEPKAASARLAKAVTRLEDALALYPEDSRVGRLTFFLADAYRQSSSLMTASADDAGPTVQGEAERRLRLAFDAYSRVKHLLSQRDSAELTSLEQTYLRASYLYAGDCLFDMGDYERAVDSYRETAWRYENEPAAVAAMMQVVNCYVRLGRRDEAKAALSRMQWLLKKIPEAAFAEAGTVTSRKFWIDMAKRLERAEFN